MTRLATPTAQLPSPADRLESDIVIYDGNCVFCRAQVSRLSRWDTLDRLSFISLHDEEIQGRWPDLQHADLMRQMYVVAADGRKYGGAQALRYLSRRLPRLWWLAPLLYVPFSLPIWNALYRLVASWRYKILGQTTCDEHCGIHR